MIRFGLQTTEQVLVGSELISYKLWVMSYRLKDKRYEKRKIIDEERKTQCETRGTIDKLRVMN